MTYLILISTSSASSYKKFSSVQTTFRLFFLFLPISRLIFLKLRMFLRLLQAYNTFSSIVQTLFKYLGLPLFVLLPAKSIYLAQNNRDFREEFYEELSANSIVEVRLALTKFLPKYNSYRSTLSVARIKPIGVYF